jgi:hypothetical protein
VPRLPPPDYFVRVTRNVGLDGNPGVVDVTVT